MRSLLAAAALAVCLAGPATAEPRIVVTIKPIHSLVAQVTEGVTEPRLLIDGALSPHTYALKPSDAAALQEADAVIWVGESLEGFLADALGTLAPDAASIELSEAHGLTLLPLREGAIWAAHDHGHDGDHEKHDDHGHDEAHKKDDDHGHDEAHKKDDDHGHDEAHKKDDDHGHGAIDAHVWLDPNNAVAMTRAVATALAEIDPGNAARYAANADAAVRRIETLDAALAALLEPVRERPFLVFHDAYQYFDRRYRLAAAGSITLGDARNPGPRHIQELREVIAERGVVCVFSEPQFSPAAVSTVIEGSGARTASLDPVGAAETAGPGAYEATLRALAATVRDCLAPK